MALNKIKINNITNVNTGVVYDITKATGQSYTNLKAALGTDGNNVPLEVREGGMSIRFVQTSDNKYVQYRLITTSFSTTKSDWQSDAIDEPMLPIADLVGLPSQSTVPELLPAFNIVFYTLSGKVRLVGTCTSMTLYTCLRNHNSSTDVEKNLGDYEGDFDVTIDVVKELYYYMTEDFKAVEVAINSETYCTVTEAYATSDIVSDILGQKKYNIYKTYNRLDFQIKNTLVFPNGSLQYYDYFDTTHLLEIPKGCVYMSVKDVYSKQYYDNGMEYAFGGISLFDADKNFIATVLEPKQTLVNLEKYPEARYIQASFEMITHSTYVPTRKKPEINFLTDGLVSKLAIDNNDLIDKMAFTVSYSDTCVYGWNDETIDRDFSNTPETTVATVKNSATDISGLIKSITVKCSNSGTLRFCVGVLDQRSQMIPSQYFEIDAKYGYHTYNVFDKAIGISEGQQLFVYVGVIDTTSSVLGFVPGNESHYSFEHEMIYGKDTEELQRLPTQYGGLICLEYTVINVNSIFSLKSETEALKSQINEQNKIIAAQQFVYDSTGNAYEIKVINRDLVARPMVFKNVQLFGNSLTNHGYLPSIGWYGADEWAMAASTREMGWNKRFLNILKQKQPEAKLQSFNVAIWERTPSDYLTEEAFTAFISNANIDPDVDLFIFKAGENNIDTANFEKALDVMISYLSKTYPKATILMCTCFWADATKDAAIANIANKYGTKYLTSTGGEEMELLGDMTYGEEGELHPIINGGVATHVSDYGFYLWTNKLAEFFGYTPDTDNYNINITAAIDYRILRTTKPAGGVVSILVQTETQPLCTVTTADSSAVTVTWYDMADVQWQTTPSYKPTYVATFTMPNQDINVTLNS